MAETEEEQKNLLMRVKKESENGLETQHSKNYNHGIWSHHFMANRMGKKWKQWHILFSWAPKSLQMVTATIKLKDVCLLEESL